MAKYFIRQNGTTVQGPFEEDKIKVWIRQGRVRAEFEFSQDGAKWDVGDGHVLFDEVERPVAVGGGRGEPVLHSVHRKEPVSDLVACPTCAEMIQRLARKCRFCGEWVVEGGGAPKRPFVRALVSRILPVKQRGVIASVSSIALLLLAIAIGAWADFDITESGSRAAARGTLSFKAGLFGADMGTEHLSYWSGSLRDMKSELVSTAVVATITAFALVAAIVIHGVLIVRGAGRRLILSACVLSAVVVGGAVVMSRTGIYARLRQAPTDPELQGGTAVSVGASMGTSFWISGVALLIGCAQWLDSRSRVLRPDQVT